MAKKVQQFRPPVSHRRIADTVLAEYGLRPSRVTVLQGERQLALAALVVPGSGLPSADGTRKVVIRIDSTGLAAVPKVRSQCQWLRAIANATDIHAPRLIGNHSGDDVTVLGAEDWETALVCTVTRWVEGRRRFLPTGPGEQAMLSIGQLMARLHRHGEQFIRPKGFDCPTWNADGLFGAPSPWCPEKPQNIDRRLGQLLDRVIGRACEAMTQLDAARGAQGLIHGDLTQANCVFDRGRAAAIDFGDFGHGYYFYDMAVTLLMLQPFDGDGRQAVAFLDGYRGIRLISIEQERLIDTMIAARAALLVRWIVGMKRPLKDDLKWAAQTVSRLRDGAKSAFLGSKNE